jgi:PAS domain S-box-containing protein
MEKEEKMPKEIIRKHRDLLIDSYREHYFGLLVKSVKDYAIYMLDKRGNVISWNDGAENIKGYKADEIIGKHFSCFYTLEDQKKGVPERNLTFAELEGQFESKGWRVRKNGDVFWANTTIAPLHTEDGELLGFAKVTRDLTEQKRSEEHQQKLQSFLQTAAQEWQMTFNAIESPIIVLDSKGKILRTNKATNDLATTSNFGNIVGKNIKTLNKKEPWKTAYECMKFIKANHSAISCQVQDITTKKNWDISITFSNSTQTLAERIILVIKDISKLVELQESLRRSEMMSALGSLVAGVAHEVRNPLFSMTATLDAFEEDFPDHPEYKEYLDILHSELTRLTYLMRDLLEYGKPSNQELIPSPIDIVINQAIKACELLSNEQKVKIEYQITKDLLVPMDESRLIQVFQNLLDNAIRHSPKNSTVKITVNTTTHNDATWLEAIVQDSGPGFIKEDMPKVFEPFFSKRSGGTGLGLPIVNRIVDQHNGKIAIANSPEGGAKVTVLLPVIENQKTQASEAE